MDFKKVSKEIFEPVKENKKTFEKNFKDKLSEIFPSTVKDGQVDFKALLEELGEYVDTKERYELTWSGKQNAKKKANEDIVGRTLKYVPEDSKNPETTENLYIEGDNLEVLKLLINSYYNKIKMIYIDPPYNTGKDFVYNDDFSQSEKQTEIEEGDISDNERLIINQKSNGKYHSNWLSMMYPRLRIAKGLLKDDGVIFISIDNNEDANLKLLCDDIFGEENYLGSIVRSTGQTTGQDSGGLGSSFDYILTYAKDTEVDLSGLPLTKHDLKRFENEDEKGKYAYDQMRKTGSNDRREDRPNMYYAVKNPDGNDVYPIAPAGYESCWRFEKKTYERLVEENIILWKKTKRDGKEVWWPYVKYYLEGRTKRPSPLWTDLDGNKKATRDVRALFDGNKVFDYAKPVDLIIRLLKIVPNADENDIILDFFSGSATTAHAVMQLNAEDGGKRKFIMIQIPETVNEKDNKESYDFLKTLEKPFNICEIGKERIRRAGEKIFEENKDKKGIENLDVGFKVFKTSDTNIRWFSEAINGNLTPLEETTTDKDKLDFNDRFTDIDVVYEILLRHRDIPLSSKIENLKEIGKRTYMFADAVVVCLETEITEEIVDKIAAIEPMPIKIIFRDSAFGDNISLKENTMIRLEAQIKKNSGIMKKSYRIEFI